MMKSSQQIAIESQKNNIRATSFQLDFAGCEHTKSANLIQQTSFNFQNVLPDMGNTRPKQKHRG